MIVPCKTRVCPIFLARCSKGIPNWSVVCFVSHGSFSVSLLCLGFMWCFVSLFLVVSTSAIGFLERLVSETTYYVSSGMLNPTHSLVCDKCSVGESETKLLN